MIKVQLVSRPALLTLSTITLPNRQFYCGWNNAAVLHVYLQPLLPNFADSVVTTTNPNETGERPRILGDVPRNSPIILNYAVRKPDGPARAKSKVYQTDYVEKWQGTDAG